MEAHSDRVQPEIAADTTERSIERTMECDSGQLDSCSAVSAGSLAQLIRPNTPDTEISSLDVVTTTTREIYPDGSSIRPQPRGPRKTPRISPLPNTDVAGTFSCCGINWCDWFPKMCSCVNGNGSGNGGHPANRGSYERLGSAPTLYELGHLQSLNRLQHGQHQRDSDNEKQEELCFFNDDHTYQTVVVEKNLCASDLCQLLALKNRVPKDVTWTIIETWPELGLERSLEDHEDVLSVHRDMELFAPQYERRFIFRKDFRKYEFFHDPQQFFPPDMVDVDSSQLRGMFLDTNVTLQKVLTQGGECPPFFSSAWIRDPGKNVWAKTHMILRDRKLYVTPKISTSATKRPGAIDTDQLHVLARLSDYHVYWTLNARKQFRAPTEWAICLRPSSNAEAEETRSELRCIAFDNEKQRACWVTAMRLAKYGKQLRENYRAFKNKQCESTVGQKEYNSYTVPNESVRSRVAMDFTGSVGRIVEDPKEARAIAVAEGTSWKRRWRPASRPPPDHSLVRVQGIEAGIHIAQPWFHSGMSRDQAATLVSKHGTVDGVFLVRESRSNPGAFVLTYKCGGKVLHTQIQPIMDHVRDTYCYSLDSGVTKFYDILQLVEFYQLNAGCLPTRLTHYVVQSPTGPPIQEESNASPTATPSGRLHSPSTTPTPTPALTPTLASSSPVLTPTKPSSF